MTRAGSRGGGRGGGGPRLPAHQVTTRNLGAAYPLVMEAGLGHRGVLVGRDLLGGSFVYDPFELYAADVVSSPNMIVFGQIGRGKSSFVKSYLWRQAVFGRRAWVVDPKGEYGPLAEAWGVRPVALRPGGPVRLNPLDPGPGRAPGARSGGAPGGATLVGEVRRDGGDPEEARRRSALLGSLASASLGRELGPRERVAVDLALDAAGSGGGVVTIPAVVDAMLSPRAEAARQVRTDRASLLEDGRDVALELRRLVHGDLRGMFDGPTSAGIDLGGPLVVLDLSALYDSAALGILMVCATAWLHAASARVAPDRPGASGHQGAPPGHEAVPGHEGASGGHEGLAGHEGTPGGHVLVVVDEAWAILANLGVARWLQASWKLSRARGVSNIAILHRLSDLQTVGGAGSQQVGLAEGLLSDSETRVVFAQPPGEVRRAAELLSLSPTEAEILPQLGRGVALWKVGHRSFLVQHLVGRRERALVDTDRAMRPAL